MNLLLLFRNHIQDIKICQCYISSNLRFERPRPSCKSSYVAEYIGDLTVSVIEPVGEHFICIESDVTQLMLDSHYLSILSAIELSLIFSNINALYVRRC